MSFSKLSQRPALLPWLLGLLAGGLFLPSLAADEPLRPDDRVKVTKMPNGLTWLYRQHANPPGKMAMMMRIGSGSLNETDEQRGLAHFIEHMAFNGTENYPPGELIRYFESIGMEFGADLNAFTGFDQTAYMLFLPDATTEQVDRGLLVLSDQGFRLLLLEKEIDRERGVILEEARSRKSAQQRIIDKLFPELFAGSRFGQRLPIGQEDVISNAPRSAFEDYYHTWYRPEATTLIMVGDAPADAYEPLVRRHFGEVRTAAPARPPHKAEFQPFREPRAIVVTDPEYASGEVELYDIFPQRDPMTTESGFRTRLIERLASWILNRRLSERIKQGQASFREGSVGMSDFVREAVLFNASVTGEPGDWPKMLAELVAELLRADEHGFLPRELELARSELLADAERAVRTESTRNANALIFQINSAVNSGDTLLSAEERLNLLRRHLPEITLQEISAALMAYVRPDRTTLVLTLPEKEGVAVPDSAAVLAAYREALATRPEPPKEREAAAALLAAEPTRGSLGELETDADLGVTSGWLSNGVRVHHRFMDYKKDSVLLTISLAGGTIEETRANEGVTQAAVGAYRQKATGRLSSTEITDLLTGKNINVTLTAGQDALILNISGSPRDLAAGLELAHAIITDAKIEESGFRNWRQGSIQQMTMAQKLPDYVAARELMKRIGGDDPRLNVTTVERIEQQTLERSQEWLTRILRTAPIEVAVVGELTLDDARPLLETYLGSLNDRPRTAAHLNALRKVTRSPGPYELSTDVETITPKAVVMCGFIGTDIRAVADVRALQLAAQVLDSRLVKRVREELGLVYSISAQNQPGRVFEDLGIFMSAAPCDPSHAADVVREVHALYQAVADTLLTPEELENARKQVYNNLDVELKEPSYWLGVLRSLDLHGLRLDDYKEIPAAYAAITAEQVQATFRRYYNAARRYSIAVVPKAAATPAPASGVPASDAPPATGATGPS